TCCAPPERSSCCSRRCTSASPRRSPAGSCGYVLGLPFAQKFELVARGERLLPDRFGLADGVLESFPLRFAQDRFGGLCNRPEPFFRLVDRSSLLQQLVHLGRVVPQTRKLS